MRFEMFDERFTSTIAHRAMLDSGMKRSDRRKKETVDTMAACIILNDYLESLRWQ
jgi:putative Holliday junction resolvase